MTTPPPNNIPSTPGDRTLLRAAVALIVLATLLRLLIIVITPFELAGDEAQYWDWSRRLALSYYSKGPGVAWTIAASTAVFGDQEWAVRLPAVLAGAVTLLAGLWLAAQLTPRAPGRAALGAVLALLAIPALHGASLLMTIDSPYVACWALSCALAWRLWTQMSGSTARPPLATALLLGLALGLAFLYKYTALILPAGLLLFLAMHRTRVRNWSAARAALMIATLAFALCTLPVIIWNAQHDWPTVRHLLGHLGMPGGDLPPKTTDPPVSRFFGLNTLEYVAGQLGVVGPLLILAVLATIDAHRGRAHDAQDAERNSFLMLAGWPIFLFYLVVSFSTDTEANWPMAGAFTLAVLAARRATVHLDTWRERVRTWRALPRPRPRQGLLLARPESIWQVLWHAAISVGAASLLFLGAAPWLTGAPIVGKLIPVERVSGARALASAVNDAQASIPGAHIIATRYDLAALLAYYLPDHPPVSSASAFLGDRASGYDHFADTRLDNPALVGQPVVLVGGSERKWSRSRVQLVDRRVIDEERRIIIARFEGITSEVNTTP